MVSTDREPYVEARGDSAVCFVDGRKRSTGLLIWWHKGFSVAEEAVSLLLGVSCALELVEQGPVRCKAAHS